MEHLELVGPKFGPIKQLVRLKFGPMKQYRLINKIGKLGPHESKK
jgi:hypothetical protein